MPPPPISRRGVLGLSAAAVVAATTAAVSVGSASAEDAKDETEAKDVHPMVIECLADLNARK